MLDILKSLLGSKTEGAAKPAPFSKLSARQTKEQLKTPGTLLVDVREPHEFAAGHIPGARLMPLGEVLQHAEELRGHPAVVMVCRSGNRSGMACAQLARLGVANLHNLDGGMNAWSREGFDIARGAK